MDLIEIYVNAYKGYLRRKLISRIYSALQKDRSLFTM